MLACYSTESHQSRCVFVSSCPHHWSYWAGQEPEEDIMEIPVIGNGVTQFLRAVTFDYAMLVVVKVDPSD